MTTPTLESFVTVLTGWVFAPRRTVTRMILAAGDSAGKHYSSYHRLFSAARWSLDAVGLAVFELVAAWCGDTIFVAIDDTLARKRGLKMFGVGMHHDPLLSSRGKVITNWGHSWVVLGVIVRLPFRDDHYYCLPILFRLYLNKKKAAKHRRAYRKRTELAVEMLRVLCDHQKNRRFHAVADSAYGGASVLCHLPANCDLTSRLVKDARLYDAPPARQPGQRGRSRVRGNRLPTPQKMLAGRCRRLSLDIYGRTEEARVADVEARVHAAPDRPLRVVAVEAIQGGRGQEAFYSTCHEATAEQVIGWYAARWSIEVSFHDSKQSLGFQEPQGWKRRAVERTAPVAMLLYSLIVLWFASEGHRRYRPLVCPWYTSKAAPSFADMLATLRRASIRRKIFSLAPRGPGSRKIRQLLENAIALAA
ncbi:MAG: transposase [Planctomycetota bacterium]|nr:MAG: transposase [Planctomycetota bacterium]